MTIRLRSRRAFLSIALFVCCVTLSPVQTLSQQESLIAAVPASPSQEREDVDLEVQVQLLIGSNEAGGSARLPPSLETISRQLRATLPFEYYRAGAAFVNRVKNGRNLDVRGTGTVVPMMTPPNNPYTPTFYQFSLRPVEIKTNASGREVVNINEFNFGLKVPITTSLVTGSGSSPAPVVQYENTGISTGLSVREGEPVVIGTLYFGPASEAIIVVMTMKKISQR